MAQAAVFRIMNNDGKADKLICAPDLLDQRLSDVKCFEQLKNPNKEYVPTIADIEKTHILYVAAHYRAFVSMGLEYTKVQPQSGTVSLGNDVKFSIPQYGDFFHDMILHLQLSSCSSGTFTAPTQPSTAYPADDVVASSETPAANYNKYSLVSALGAVVGSGATTPVSWVRWCEYPGERILSDVQFAVNGNPLDEYTYEDIAMLRKFALLPNKVDGYKRLMGQEVPLEAYSGPTTSTVSSYTTYPANITDYCRYKKQIVDGPQTPRITQPALDLWIKIRFWFCDNIALSIPSVSIPYGQRDLTVSLAAQGYLVQPFQSVYLATTVKNITINGASAVILNSVARTYTPLASTYAGTLSTITVQKCELYVNNIFVSPNVHDIYIKRIDFTLIRVYLRQSASVTASSNYLLNNLKYPLEYLWFGFQPTENQSTANPNMWREWHHMNKVMYGSLDHLSSSYLVQGTTAALATAVVSAAPNATVGQYIKDEYVYEYPTVSTIELDIHGVRIFDSTDAIFYGSYLPYHYGGINLNTPDDSGAYMINFAVYPRTYQPSGHLNASRSREFYLQWTTAYATTTYTVRMIVIAIAINFLLIANGSAVIRYTT